MALKLGIPNIFDQPGLFRISPEDGQVLIFQGSREIPADQPKVGIPVTIEDISPETMADDDAVGAQAWSDVNNAKTSDNVYVTGPVGQALPYDDAVKIVKSDGSIGSEDKSLVAVWSTSEAYFSYGASDDLWSESWTAADINSSNFGVVLSVAGEITTHYLKATNFGFSIPEGAIIDGIIVEIERKYHFVSGPDINVCDVDHIKITIHYTI